MTEVEAINAVEQAVIYLCQFVVDVGSLMAGLATAIIISISFKA